MKKILGLLFLGLFLVSLFSGFVSAGPVEELVDGANIVINGIFEILTPLFHALTGGEITETDSMVATILFLIIIFGIVYTALSKSGFFNTNAWVLWTITLGVSLLSVRVFASEDLMNAVFLPYSTLGVVLTAGIPFVLYFLIVKDLGKTARKMSWIFFSVVFVVLWFIRFETLGTYASIYLLTAAAGLTMLLMDGTIQRGYNKMKLDRKKAVLNHRRITQLEDEMEELADHYKKYGRRYASRYSPGYFGEAGYKKDLEEIEKKINTIQVL